MSLTMLALHQSGPAPVAADRELSVEEGLRLIAGQTGSFSFFLTFEGSDRPTNLPRGESNAAPGAISVRAFSLGAENPAAVGSATSGAGTGKVKFNEVKIAKAVDSASPAIFANLASGGHMRQATLVVRRAGTGGDYLFWQFGTVYFSKVDWSGEGDGLTEHVTMSYGSLRISYARTSSTGTLSPPVTTQWNQVTNTPVYAAQ